MFNTRLSRAGALVGATALVCVIGALIRTRQSPPAATPALPESVPNAIPSTSALPSPEEIAEPLPPANPFSGGLDCKGLGPTPPASCPAPTGPLPDLVRAGNGFFMGGGGRCGFTNLLRGDRLASAMQALRAASAHGWNAEPIVERVVGQNAALRLLLCAEGEATAALRQEALKLVHQLALPGSELDALGSEPVSEVRSWLGDPAAWQDLQSRNQVPVHEGGYGRTKSVRAMIVGDWLVNLGQLVAIDAEWKPHVTPFVGSLEVRRPYRAEQVTVCAASLDVGWLRCGAPAGLRTFAPETESLDPLAPVMFRTDQGRTPCRGCHLDSGKPKSIEVPLEEGRLHAQAQRASLLHDVSIRLQSVRQE